MGWTKAAPNVVDLSGLETLPDRVELYGQGEDDAGAFERRLSRHDFLKDVQAKPVRNAKGEIEAKETVTISIQGAEFDPSALTVTFPARPGWPDAPFSMVKAVAVYNDESKTDVVLFEKVLAE